MTLLSRLSRLCGRALTALLAVILLGNLYAAGVYLATGERPRTVLGFASAVVVSGSMSPAIEVEDMVIIHSQRSYREGDVITYADGHHLVTHRISKITADGLITRGDANNADDLRPVSPQDVVGRVVLVIPRAGLLIEWIKTPMGLSCMVFIALLLIELPLLTGGTRARSRETENQERRENQERKERIDEKRE